MKATATYLIGVLAIVIAGCSATAPRTDVPSHEVEIENLGPLVNSVSNDFSPTITANGAVLYFTSGRGLEERASAFWVSRLDRGFWGKPTPLGPPFSAEKVIGNPSISADGQSLYVACQRPDGFGSVDIYTSQLSGKEWGALRNLGRGVNSEAWESQPSISPDGQTLYFVSNRTDGIGGLDIWSSEKNEAGHWLPAVNLGPVVNTPSDEVTPFIAADDMTLYFASDGHAGLLGTDLFVSRRIQSVWSVPENMGAPLNSDENDEFLTLTAEGTVIYYASKRSGGTGGLDLYRAKPNPFPPKAVMVVSGSVLDANSRQPLEAVIKVIDRQNQNTIGEYASNSLTGEFVIVLPSGTSYRLAVSSSSPYLPDSLVVELSSLQSYSERSADFLLLREQAATELSAYLGTDVPLTDFTLHSGAKRYAGLHIEEIEAGETIPLLPYVFFNASSAALPQRYSVIQRSETPLFDISKLPDGAMAKYRHLLNIIGARLLSTPEATITLTGTLADDEAEGGPVLAERRAEVIADYLMSVWNIGADRIRTNATRRPQNPSSGTTDEGMDENRRVELSSSDPRILAPVNTRSIERQLTPPTAVFYPKVFSDNGMQSWELVVTQNENSFYIVSGGAEQLRDSVVWNWTNENSELPQDGVPLEARLRVTDVEGNTQVSQRLEIPVHATTVYKTSANTATERTIDRIHLILFDYNQSALSHRNVEMLDALRGKIEHHSTITVRGFTDVLGESEYNMELSMRRAQKALALLKERYPNVRMQAEGLGETEPLFDQSAPEGRFYSRTVIVIIESSN